MKLDFNDLLIVPKEVSSINSREKINPFDIEGFLPLMTAPMDTVVNQDNAFDFNHSKIRVCMPRNDKSYVGFNSYSYNDIKKLYDSEQLNEYDSYLIDVANGHMSNILDITLAIKTKYKSLKLMVGNFANPKTYTLLSNAGADYVRVGIGNGGGCLLENSIILTKLGDKLIQDVEIGDYVLTHTGEYKKVISVIAYPSREELIKINDTISTKTHEYYVLNKKYKDLVNDENIHNYAEWIKAENLTNEYFLLEYEDND